MPEVTADQLKRTYKGDPVGTSHSLAESLRDFGYLVTDDWVKEEIDRLLRGEEPRRTRFGLGPAECLQSWLTEGYDLRREVEYSY